MCSLYFFLFKQKTAYEMRISDWSSDVCSSDLTFKRLHPDEIEAYIRSGEWQGKAGGYAIQGCAAGLIRSMSGNYSGVVGLPLFDVRTLLLSAGYPLA